MSLFLTNRVSLLSPLDKSTGNVTGIVDMGDFGGGSTDGLGSCGSLATSNNLRMGSRGGLSGGGGFRARKPIHKRKAKRPTVQRWAGLGCAMRSYDHGYGG